jgi:glycosyltransferase involved in cell wall biosynthesis
MNVVVLDADISYPPTSGKRLRTLNLMLPLARRHRLTYLARGDAHAAEARAATEFLRGHGVETVDVHHPLPRKRGAGFYLRLAGNLLSPLPYSMSSHVSEPMRRAAEGLASRNQVDLWHVEAAPCLHALRNVAGARTALSAPNVESLIWQRYAEVEANPLKRWFCRTQWKKYERYERRAFATATRVVAVSEEDAALVRGRFGVETVDVVDNGIDTSYFENVRACPEPGRVLFLGSLEWRPNPDAVRLLLDRILPVVRAAEPSARLSIVGRRPPAWLVQRVRSEPVADLQADVADVRPYLARAAVLAVPLRIGGGSRLKILEALGCGVPVVSTRVGAEGLALRDGEHLTVVEGANDMAAALVRCLRNPAAAQAQAERGRRVVLARYDWGPLADRLEQSWEKCLLPAGAPRQRQAVG